MTTIIDVLDAALDVWGKPGGVAAMLYCADKNREHVRPGTPNVAMACAMGGVEHAVWKLTGGYDGSGYLHHMSWLTEAEKPEPLNPDDRYSLFRETMVALNLAAHVLYDEEDLTESACAAEAALFTAEDDYESTGDQDADRGAYELALQERMLAMVDEAKSIVLQPA